MPQILLFFIVLLGALTVSGCASVTPTFYKLDVRQGNYLDSELIGRLQVGMSKRQVQFLLGTPLIADPFHQTRWDYLYSFRPEGGDETEKYHVSLYFEGDTLARITGDYPPVQRG